METKEKQKAELEIAEHTLATVSLAVVWSGKALLTKWTVETPLIERIKELSKIMKGNKA